MLEIVNLIPSARNQQVLRYKKVQGKEAKIISSTLKLGLGLPELQLPVEGHKPQVFIVICSTVSESKWVDIDLGIAVQSILLKSVEMGMNGICIGSFDKQMVKENCKLAYEPLLLLAFGKGDEKIELKKISENESHEYYRIKGNHIVPKIKLEDLILK